VFYFISPHHFGFTAALSWRRFELETLSTHCETVDDSVDMASGRHEPFIFGYRQRIDAATGHALKRSIPSQPCIDNEEYRPKDQSLWYITDDINNVRALAAATDMLSSSRQVAAEPRQC